MPRACYRFFCAFHTNQRTHARVQKGPLLTSPDTRIRRPEGAGAPKSEELPPREQRESWDVGMASICRWASFGGWAEDCLLELVSDRNQLDLLLHNTNTRYESMLQSQPIERK